MSSYSAEALYRLLPAVDRERDADHGYVLRDLTTLLAREAGIVERDIRRLYDNWFIETCDEWVVPYLGDLLAVRGVASTGKERYSRRAEVANTLHYRRGKGTARVLEELARDVTGWPARVVEFFELLGTTQYLNHLRGHNLRTPDLRATNALEHVDGPFDTAAHTLEVRRIAVERGKYNIPNIGLFLYRLTAFPLRLTVPHRLAEAPHYTFTSLGYDAPLFTLPASEESRSHIAEEIHVPAPIRRRALHHHRESYYGAGLSVAVYVGRDAEGEWQLVPPEDVVACDLEVWDRELPEDVSVALDPVLGRLRFAAEPEADVRVAYHHGMSAEIGGGQYEREASLTEIGGELLLPVGEDEDLTTVAAALAAWGELGSAVIEIRDSRTYEETLTIHLPEATRLEIRARNGQRPTLRLGDELIVDGEAESGFELNGLLVADQPLRIRGDLDRLTLQHTTLVPGRSLAEDGEPLSPSATSLFVESAAAQVVIRRSILGALRVDPGAEVGIEDAIVDAQERDAAAYDGPEASDDPGGPLTVARSTVIGTVSAREIPLAEDVIFLGTVSAERRQSGCVRFSHVPLGSRVPRRFRCQPEVPAGASEDEARRIARRVLPTMTSLRYADPGYAQLDRRGPEAIRRGASNESEMGAFSSLFQPQREDALRTRLEEYLRLGLEAGIFFVT